MEVLARRLERTDHTVTALVRARDDDDARRRLDEVLTNLFGLAARRYRSRVEAHAADLTAPRLGLTAARERSLAQRVTTIIHSAANVSFTQPLCEARATNVQGTQRMLDFAELAAASGGLDRYAHISTAYVAGTHAGRFTEQDLDLGQGFNNAYEQSKYEAEILVRERRSVPYTVLRPSIVVGDKRSGWTSAFNVLYWPLRAFERGLFTAVPADPTAPCDVVSVDYVADAIHALCEAPGGIGETYHLSAGRNASTIAEIAGLASRYFRRPLPHILSPAEFAARLETADGTRRAAMQAGIAYFPYFSTRAQFDESRARAQLGPEGPAAAPLREYMERLLDFATRSRWGKRPITRVDALHAAGTSRIAAAIG
jgi:thioester reductase-like protein